jgi:hypothetical protein
MPFGNGDRVRVAAETPNMGRRVVPRYAVVPAGSTGTVEYYPSGRAGQSSGDGPAQCRSSRDRS